MTIGLIALTVIAGGLAALARHLIQTAAPGRRGRSAEPADRSAERTLSPAWRILIINVVASFLAGFAIAMLPAEWEPVAIAGVCGGLSTWSTFMVDAHDMWRSGHRMRAFAFVAAHVGYGLVAAIAGLWLGSWV